MGLIRLLLALSVVAAHCGHVIGLKLVGGKIAVEAFFIISGFYMTLILNEKYTGVNNSYRLFITNRLMRLFPIYWVILFASVGLSLWLEFVVQEPLPTTISRYLSVEGNVLSFVYLVSTNLFILGQDVVMFLGIQPDTGALYFTKNFFESNPPLYCFLFITQAWTLGLEIMFYFVAPLLLRKGTTVVLSLIAASFFLRLVLYNCLDLKGDPWSYRFFPTELMFFLLGYFSYYVYKLLENKQVNKRMHSVAFWGVVSFTLLYPYLPSISLRYFPFTVKEVLYFTSFTLAIPLVFYSFKNKKWDSSIGELSYPVYIAHMLVYYVYSLMQLPTLHIGWLTALTSIAVGLLLNRVVAVPIEKYRQGRLRR